MSQLKERIQTELKEAMKAGDASRRDALRMMTAALKQVEVDERITLDEARILAILDKMLKQRRESIAQFREAGRQDLIEKEEYEAAVIQAFLPAPLSDAEIDALIEQAIQAVGGALKQNMGKIMAHLKPQVQGRADGSAVSEKVKAKLVS